MPIYASILISNELEWNGNNSHLKSNCASDRKIKAGKENVPIKAFKPFVSLWVISPDFPAIYLDQTKIM